MSDNLTGFAFAVAAPILLTILIARPLPKERRPPMLWLCASGAATAYLALLLEGFAAPALLGTSPGYLPPVELAFGLVAPIEEIVKIPVLHSQITSKPEPVRPIRRCHGDCNRERICRSRKRHLLLSGRRPMDPPGADAPSHRNSFSHG